MPIAIIDSVTEDVVDFFLGKVQVGGLTGDLVAAECSYQSKAEAQQHAHQILKDYEDAEKEKEDKSNDKMKKRLDELEARIEALEILVL